MTQQEVTALKARFKAGGIPTQQDFEALIDAIAGGSSTGQNTQNGPTVIHVTNVLRNNLIEYYSYNETAFNGTNPFVATCVADIISAYERLNDTSLADAESVIIINESWDYKFDASNGTESALKGFTSLGDDSATERGTNVPIYIRTKYANVLPDLDDSSNPLSTKYSNLTEFGDSYASNGGHDPQYVIEVIPDGNAMMFVKRLSYTDKNNNSNTIDWVPVGRNTTITEYELGQMEQTFNAAN